MPRGGPRPGAGRPRKSEAPTKETKSEATKELSRDPLQFLLDVMQGAVKPSTDQLRAGIAAAQYVHSKAQEGKRAQAQKDAVAAAGGRFKTSTPPKLIVNNK